MKYYDSFLRALKLLLKLKILFHHRHFGPNDFLLEFCPFHWMRDCQSSFSFTKKGNIFPKIDFFGPLDCQKNLELPKLFTHSLGLQLGCTEVSSFVLRTTNSQCKHAQSMDVSNGYQPGLVCIFQFSLAGKPDV